MIAADRPGLFGLRVGSGIGNPDPRFMEDDTMFRKMQFLAAAAFLCLACRGQSRSPSVSQVLMYSATTPLTVQTLTGASSFTLNNAVPGIFTETANTANLAVPSGTAVITNGSNYSVSRRIVQLNNALNASIATSLSIVPLSSPASGVIVTSWPGYSDRAFSSSNPAVERSPRSR